MSSSEQGMKSGDRQIYYSTNYTIKSCMMGFEPTTIGAQDPRRMNPAELMSFYSILEIHQKLYQS